MSDTTAEHAELIRELASGERRFHALPAELGAEDAATIRRAALEQRLGVDLSKIGEYGLNAEAAADRHCENMIGATQIPVGVAGPIAVRGQYADGDFFVPLATTEGALIASINRGCTAIRAAGGAVVHVEDVGITRAPVFKTSGLQQTRALLDWVEANEDQMREVAEATSRYLQLLDVRTYAIGTTVFLRFRFSSGDAMGMNMATIACDRVVRELVEPATGVACIALSGNYCVDKKPSAVNFQLGRGKRLQAEVVLDADVLRRLKTTAAQLVEVQYRKNLMGSIAAGSIGYNAHFANVLAAFFLATGQDPAHVAEASMGVTTIEPVGEDGVIASVYLPDAPVAAVGGGTGLETQREALAILGVVPDPDRPGEAALRLAEILAATVLAGEISLMAAFTSQDLAGAHERLGRSSRD